MMAATNYRKLCQELFGTDDVESLRNIAAQLQQKNPRGAGRRKKFTAADRKKMQELQQAGVSVQEIARQFGTSRQLIGKYLCAPRPDGTSLRLIYMYHHQPCTVIDVDFLRQKVYIQNRTSDILHRAFGVNEAPDWADFEDFLRERCFPSTRGFLEEELRCLGLDTYDPLQIVEKTGGRTAEDDMWLKFQYDQEGRS